MSKTALVIFVLSGLLMFDVVRGLYRLHVARRLREPILDLLADGKPMHFMQIVSSLNDRGCRGGPSRTTVEGALLLLKRDGLLVIDRMPTRSRREAEYRRIFKIGEKL